MQPIFLFSLLAGVATIAGSLIVLFRDDHGRRHLFRIMAFAAGSLLGVAFVHLIPEAVARAGQLAAWGLAIGFVAFFCSGAGDLFSRLSGIL